MSKQYISRTCSYDMGHRVLRNWDQSSVDSATGLDPITQLPGKAGACNNVHGHSYLFELTFEFDSSQSSKKIGYHIDFKEIKRVFMHWIEKHMDHGFVANPEDVKVINLCKEEKTKYWIMTLNDGEFCNPSAENIVKEIFIAFEILCEKFPGLTPYKIKMNETPNCYTECFADSITDEERQNFRKHRYEQIKEYSEQMGVYVYDSAELPSCQI